MSNSFNIDSGPK